MTGLMFDTLARWLKKIFQCVAYNSFGDNPLSFEFGRRVIARREARRHVILFFSLGEASFPRAIFSGKKEEITG